MRDWQEGNLLGNHLYFNESDGRIVGEISRVGASSSENRSSASVYPSPTETKILGQFISSKHAKAAVESYWIWQDSILSGNILEA